MSSYNKILIGQSTPVPEGDSEVEDFLSAYPKIKEAVVVGLQDPMVGEEVCACIVLRDGEQATPEEIIQYSKERMATYKCPKLVYFVSSVPKGPTGRFLRDRVKQMVLEMNRETNDIEV